MGPRADSARSGDDETSHERRFVNALVELDRRQDRAALAALRRGLGKAPGEVVEACRYVDPWLGGQVTPWRDDAYYLVAALFAWHPLEWAGDPRSPWRTNFGASFAALARASPSEGAERRFVALLNCDGDSLPPHLRHAVGLLRAHGVAVDWVQLLRDVQRWDRDDRRVQRAWARAFWGRSEAGREAADVAAGEELVPTKA